MKHLGKLSLGMMALLMAACSNDGPVEPTPNPDPAPNGDKDVYASLTLRLPSAGGRYNAPTRAGEEDETGETKPANNGIEFGQDYENSVGKILIVLATQNQEGTYTYLTRAESDAKPNYTDVPANTVKYVLNFSSTEMDPSPLDKDDVEGGGSYIPGTTDVYVFAYCNPTAAITTYFKGLSKGDTFTGQTGTLSDGDNAEIWTRNKFLMTNCEITKVDGGIPARDVLIDNYNTPEHPYPLGTVKVKRAAARFDFMTTTTTAGVNTYEIKDIDGETKVGDIELTDMAMFNIAKQYYLLPRTSSTWIWKSPYQLCGDLEGFVVSPGTFRSAATLGNNSEHYFHYLINRKPSTLDWTSIKNWNKDADNDEGWTVSEGTDYRIWRYASENTIPGASTGTAATQKIGITTGVVFKGEFNPVNKDRWNGNAVYVHNNVVFGDFKALKEYVEKYPESTVAVAFNELSQLKNANVETIDLKKSLLSSLASNEREGFKVYEPTDGKYLMYYFYYNRHNTNGNNSVMGSNEFGVVRNNVYKLKVTKVGSFGDPEFPDDPNDPDEEEKAYFTVSCLVMPWTVRVNDIEF